MDGITKKEFLKRYLQALENGDAALFIGAGLSRPAGFVDWAGLMKDIAEDLGLSVEYESDFVAVAQFHTNTRQSRAALDELLVNEFTKDAQPTPSHSLIASLPIESIWTTNYDHLVEDAFRSSGKRPDVKTKQTDLQRPSLPRRDVTIYKMHGDMDSPSEAVLTREDYEMYNVTRPFFTESLTSDLLQKTFLFVGFSFADPNISYVLGRIRGLLGTQPRDHFLLLRPEPERSDLEGDAKAEHEYRRRRERLQIADLRRYGIQPVLIDDYSEVEDILRALSRQSHQGSVFVSGSASSYNEIDKERVDALAFGLGRGIVKRGYRVVTGLGLGIGGSVAVGALDQAYRGDGDLKDQVLLRPFPQSPPPGMTRADFWTRYRRDLVSQAGFAVFISGNKLNGEGELVSADGVREEFRLSVERGLFPIPIGATGFEAKAIWNEVSSDLDRYFPGGGISEHFDVLGDPKQSNDSLLSAVFAIIEQTRKSPTV